MRWFLLLWCWLVLAGAAAPDVTVLKHKAAAGGNVARTSNSAASGLTGTASSVTTATITTPATNPLIVVAIALSSATPVVNSITTTGFGGVTGTQVVRNNTGGASIQIWCIPAPTASTTGTATITLSASSGYSYSWTVFSGAHQTAPCPTGDAVHSWVATTPQTLTPLNLAASDGAAGSAANTGGLSFSSAAPNQRYMDNAASVNQVTGDATGTTGITIATTGGNSYNMGAIRLVAAP